MPIVTCSTLALISLLGSPIDLLSLSPSQATTNDTLHTPCGSFVRSPRHDDGGARLWKRADQPTSGCEPDASARDGGIASVSCNPIASGLEDPGPVWREGSLLFVGNTANNTAKKVTVIDVSVPGGEVVIETIATPVNPVDVAVALGRLYVIDQDRNKLYSRSLDGGAWSFIPLPNGTVTEWDYGHIIEPFGDRMYVIHQWENKISVVNLVTNTVESTITDLDHLPDRIVFVNDGGIDKMVVLGVGLDQPSCFAEGPNFSVFTLPDHRKLYRKDISGTCSHEILARDGKVWVVADNRIRRYNLADGASELQLGVPSIGRNAVHRGTDIILQKNNGEILSVDPQLTTLEPLCDLVTGTQLWFPPIEQMTAMDPADGRIFVTNRNNNTVDRVLDPTACPADLDGDASIGASDLALLLGQWGVSGNADLDLSGSVDAGDLAVLLGAWGACPPG